MRLTVLFGIILGVLLTIAGAYAYDTMTGRAPNGLPPSAADGRAPLVNWDVVGHDWNGFQENLRTTGAGIQRGWKNITS